MDQPIGSIDCFCGVSDAIEIIRQGHTEVPKKRPLRWATARCSATASNRSTTGYDLASFKFASIDTETQTFLAAARDAT